MQAELTMMWVLILLQMVALAIMGRRLKSTRSPTLDSRSTSYSSGRPFLLDKLKLIHSAYENHQQIRAYLFVSGTCPTCEEMLTRLAMMQTSHERLPTALVGVGNPEPVKQAFAERADNMGMALLSCSRPSEVGITQVPWLVTVDAKGMITNMDGAADPNFVMAQVQADLHGDSRLVSDGRGQ